MKEYKSITITTGNILNLGERLNKYAVKGWYIKDTITNGIDVGKVFEFIYLLERDVKKWKAAFSSEGFEDRFIEYCAANEQEVKKLIENETRIESDESIKYFHEIK